MEDVVLLIFTDTELTARTDVFAITATQVPAAR